MKRLALILLSVLLVTPLLITPLFCTANAETETESGPTTSFATVERLKEFTETVASIKDRTSFGSGCENAAAALADMFSSFGLESSVSEFTVSVQEYVNFFTTQTREYKSFNVEAQTEPVEGRKTVLITACFANHYGSTQAEGALGSATSTALVLALAEYYAQRIPDNLFNYKFALFSGTDEGNYGSEAYVEKNRLDDVIFVVNLERLGGGNVYYYTDEVETTHGKFISDIASGYDVKAFPTTGRVLLELSTVDGLDYSHYAMLGDNATFMSSGKACLELIGGSFGGLSSDDGDKNITNTKYDTLENLNEYYKDYAKKLMTAGEFVVGLTSREELASVCLGSAQGYKVFTKTWIAYAIGLGIIGILILILLIVTGRLEKKHPVPARPKIKVAVFGSEYEDPKDDEIVVDVKYDDSDKDDADKGDPFDI